MASTSGDSRLIASISPGVSSHTATTSLEVAETATLVAFVAAGIGVSLVPAAVANLTINGAAYRPLAGGGPTIELALAWRRQDHNPVLVRVLELIREHMHTAGTRPSVTPATASARHPGGGRRSSSGLVSSLTFVNADVGTDAVPFCAELPERAGVVGIPTSVFYDDKAAAATLVRFAFCKRPEVIAEAARRLAGLD